MKYNSMKKLGFTIILIMLAVNAFASDILIFGGMNHKDFLGCLTCNQYSNNSVFNKFSTYGWANIFGVWNPFGEYKNQFSSTSACNEYAADPPVLVDQQGSFYGRLSVNQFIGGSICGVTGIDQICIALKIMCSYK